MHELIAWCGFVGGWLLVAGPVFQAAVELEEEGLDREEFTERFASLPPPKRTSPWWWLLPPVGFFLNRHRNQRHHELLARILTRGEMERIVRFGGKATGWALVAGGACLIAVKETWELVELYEWPVWVFWVAIPVMVIAAALHTAIRVRRGHEMIDLAQSDGSSRRQREDADERQ